MHAHKRVWKPLLGGEFIEERNKQNPTHARAHAHTHIVWQSNNKMKQLRDSNVYFIVL